MRGKHRIHGPVCVTGGLGFIGSHLCRALAARGHEVVALDRLSGDYAPGSGRDAADFLSGLPGVRVLETDVRSARGTRALERVGAVIHLAALPGVRSAYRPDALRDANVTLAAEVLERASARGARFVLASTSSIYGDAVRLPAREGDPPRPLNPYARTKLEADAACLAAGRAGADASVARLFTVFGPGQRPDMAFARWIHALRNDEPVHWCAAAGARREFTYVGDAARGLVAVLERGRRGEAYNVAGCGSVPVARALAELEDLLGTSAERALRPAGGEAVATAACGHKARHELGYAPRTRLCDGLRLQVEAAAPSAERILAAA